MKRKKDSLTFEVVEASEEENPECNLDEFLADFLVRYWIEVQNKKTKMVTEKGGEYDSKVEFNNRSGESGDDNHVEHG